MSTGLKAPHQPAHDRAETPPGTATGARRQETPSVLRWVAIWLFALVNWVVPKARRKVVVHSIPDLEDGIQAVLSELLDRGFEPIVLYDAPNTPKRFAKTFGDRPAGLVPRSSLRAALHFLTARYVFVTHGLFGHPVPPPWQCIVNLWHGEPPGKVVGRYEGQPSRHATMAPVLSQLGQAFRCAAFGLHPAQVPVLGAPRNDRMLRADGERIRAQLVPEAGGRPTFLWMPTFRATAPGRHQRVDVTRHSSVLPFEAEDIDRLDRWLAGRDALIVVKTHPLNADELPHGLHAIRVLSQEDIEGRGLTVYPLLAAFDGLITDISSVWIDYLLLRRPVVFAFPDIDQYRRFRGISLEPYESWIPGPLTRSVDALMDALGALLDGRDEFQAARNEALLRMHRFRDDRSAVRVADRALEAAQAMTHPRLSSLRRGEASRVGDQPQVQDNDLPLGSAP